MAYVVIHTSTAPPQRVMLKNSMLVGRAIGSDLWIDDPKISRKHCRLESRGERWTLTNVSSNGTLVNGELIEQHRLHDGDELEIGDARLIFHEGSFIESRPADPVEAASFGMGSLQPSFSPDESTLNGFKLPEARILRSASVQLPPTKGPALAFTRPAARPIVHGPSTFAPIRWIRTLFSRFR
jgi:predicted component of type VI protein secretion system